MSDEIFQRDNKKCPPKQYALFGFNPQMWYKIVDGDKLEICELKEATIFTLETGQTLKRLSQHIVDTFTGQEPVVKGAMLVEIEDSMKRVVTVLDKRPKRDWTHIYTYLGEK